MAKLWSIVARGNSESLPTMSMTSIGAGESLFEEIKSGGNGVEQRISRVENKNIVSFLQHIIHYHEKNLSDKRRRSKAIMQLAHSDFATGSLNDLSALLHGLLRFQIELDARCTCSTVICGDGNIVMISGDDPQCLCWTARTATWAPSLPDRARRQLHMQQRHLWRRQHRHEKW